MENYEQARKLQHDSHVINTLNRQIQALTPLKLPYRNLLDYHQKITIDLASLIQQHDFVINSLKSNLQNLTTIGMRAQAQRDDLTIQFKDLQNQLAKMILDTRNMAQKFEALNQKLQLQTNRNEQNKSYRTELLQIEATIRTHIANTEQVIKQSQAQQNQSLSEQQIVNGQIQAEEKTKQSLQEYNEQLKTSIAKINVKNDDMIDANRKLSLEIRNKEEDCMNAIKKNRDLQQKLIEQKALCEKLKGQIQYKTTLLNSQNTAGRQLELHSAKVQAVINDLKEQNNLVCRQNLTLEEEISKMQKIRQQDLMFKLNSENHLAQLKQNNQLLMARMEQYCLQDREVHNILLKKMASLQFFAKKLNQKYGIEQSSKIQAVFKERTINFTQGIPYQQEKVIRTELKKSDSKKDTNTSDKAWVKQNLC